MASSTAIDHGWLVQVPRAPDRGPQGPAADPEMAQGGGHRGRDSGRRRRRGRRKGRRLRRCWRTSTCTTSSTCGSSSGGRRHARGDVIVVRYADDFVVGFEHRDDAERFLAELRERLAKFGLELHPEKTRLIEFGRFAAERPTAARARASRRRSTSSASRTSARRRRNGRFMLKRITMQEADAGQAARGQDRAAATPASAHPRARALAGERGARALRATTPCPTTPTAISAFRDAGHPALAQGAPAPQPAHRTDLGADAPPRRSMAPDRPHPASLARARASTPAPKAGAQCGSRARWDLCGGPPARAVPTANVRARAIGPRGGSSARASRTSPTAW